MDWRKPGPAMRVVVYGLNGGIAHYGRAEDADGNVVWHKGVPDDPSRTFGPVPSMTPAELLEALKASIE